MKTLVFDVLYTVAHTHVHTLHTLWSEKVSDCLSFCMALLWLAGVLAVKDVFDTDAGA